MKKFEVGDRVRRTRYGYKYVISKILMGDLLEFDGFEGGHYPSAQFELVPDLRRIDKELLELWSITDNDCQHDYTTYHGLTEVYEYCLKCDKKGRE